jgi:hypothetical protein
VFEETVCTYFLEYLQFSAEDKTNHTRLVKLLGYPTLYNPWKTENRSA